MLFGVLYLASLSAQKARISSRSASLGCDARRRLDHRLDLLAPVRVRDAEDRRVADLRVREQHALDLGRVDVDPARDDHVVLAIAQEQVLLVVEVADVADGEESGAAVLLGLLPVSLVLEVGRAELDVDGARGARRAVLALLVEDRGSPSSPRRGRRCPAACATRPASPPCRRPRWRRSTRRSSRPTSRASCAWSREGRAPRRAPWCASRTRRSACGRPRAAPSRRWNWVGTMWLVVTRYFSIRRSISSGAPAVHQHHRVSEVHGGRGEHQHGGVIERRAADVDVAVLGLAPEEAQEAAHQRGHRVGVDRRERPPHALRAAGGARGVVHHLAGGALLGERGRLARRELGVGAEARDAADREARLHRQRELARRAGAGLREALVRRSRPSPRCRPRCRRSRAPSGDG